MNIKYNPIIFRDFECALLVKGALKQDEGRWSCEIGTRRTSTERNIFTLPWTLVGDIDIEIKNSSSIQEFSIDESFTGIVVDGVNLNS